MEKTRACELLTSLRHILLEAVRMIFDSNQVMALVVRVDRDFHTTPALRLSLREAERRFGADRETCEAVLGTLVNSSVLARTDDGGYVRFLPWLAHAA
jgi:hypothetical protein